MYQHMKSEPLNCPHRHVKWLFGHWHRHFDHLLGENVNYCAGDTRRRSVVCMQFGWWRTQSPVPPTDNQQGVLNMLVGDAFLFYDLGCWGLT